MENLVKVVLALFYLAAMWNVRNRILTDRKHRLRRARELDSVWKRNQSCALH